MRLRSRPILFARVFADAATTRPFMRVLLEQRRAAEPAPALVAPAPLAPTVTPERQVPRAA